MTPKKRPHESWRAGKLYDWPKKRVTHAQVERIRLEAHATR
jgi:hypothetical protein